MPNAQTMQFILTTVLVQYTYKELTDMF